jgi:hypothetical protein
MSSLRERLAAAAAAKTPERRRTSAAPKRTFTEAGISETSDTENGNSSRTDNGALDCGSPVNRTSDADDSSVFSSSARAQQREPRNASKNLVEFARNYATNKRLKTEQVADAVTFAKVRHH